MPIPLVAAAGVVSNVSNIIKGLGGPSAAFQARDAIRGDYWSTLNKLYDMVKTPGAFTAETREQIWRDWPTFLTSSSAVTVHDPVTGIDRTSTDYGPHAGRTGSQADMDYLKGRLQVYSSMEKASGGVGDDRAAAIMPASGSGSVAGLGHSPSGLNLAGISPGVLMLAVGGVLAFIFFSR